MSIFIALILGLVQGLTEFLPVSSSGHLVLLQNIFGIENNIILFDIVLHLGTLLAVIIVYKKSILELLKNPLGKKMRMVILGTIPTLIIALLFKDFFEGAFAGNLLFVGFLATSMLLLLADYSQKKYKKFKRMDYKYVLTMGLFQGLAILPGLSRSGTTVSTSLALGVNKNESLEYSFLLSIPIILASLVYELLFSPISLASIEWAPMIVGFLASGIFGIISIKFTIKIVKSNSYKYFSIYLIILSIFLILNQFVFHIF